MEEEQIFYFDIEMMALIKLNRENQLIKARLTPELAVVDDGWGTLLHYAAYCGNDDVINYLIELGAEVDCLNIDGRTPLMLAVHTKSGAAVDALLNAEADIHVISPEKVDVICMAFHPAYDQDDIAELIGLQLYRETKETEQFVEKIINAGCSFYTASLFGNIDVLESMMNRGYDVNFRGTEGKTALHIAVEKKNLKMAEWLVERGANINAQDNFTRSVLLNAVWFKHTAMVKLFLEFGADPDIKHTIACTPLIEACRRYRLRKQRPKSRRKACATQAS
ncbi:putative ankyrin repeat protein RF_0381 [Phymastichus coffea]|uniref:putative ankyrin repeat protein RF_0381 n=1 Tax=Phymastichus coffea TaxID=108790 RepID=UPI00273CB8FE|nr:putative ankyrin repeat protein RF_0381 [Phymastichus coffea]